MPNTERLRKITEKPHGTGKFDFGRTYSETNCGTLACKMGDLPHQLPEDWTRHEWGLPRLKVDSTGYPNEDVMAYFDLTEDQFYHLFHPHCQIYDRPKLPETATEEEVNANIIDFCERVERGEIQ